MKRVSDYLKEARLKKGVSLSEAAEKTKIKRQYLDAIEEGKFSSLPSRSYVIGFVKTYASYLGLPQEKVFAFLRREYGEEKLEVVPTYRKKQFRDAKNIFKNPRVIIIGIVLIAVLFYGISQYASLFFGPKLSVNSPVDHQEITQNVVNVSGITDPYATLSINGEDTYVDISGAFKKSLYEDSGVQKITVVAKNKFGKETRKDILVKVE